MVQRDFVKSLGLIAYGAIIFGFVSVFSLATSLNGEDYAFQRKWTDQNSLDRLLWTINRSKDQIENWNARLGEQLSIFWLNSPTLVYSIVATLAFILAGYLVSLLANFDTPLPQAVAFSSLALFALWPSMDVFFWRTANAGYLQPSLFFLGAAGYYLVDSQFLKLGRSWPLIAFVSGLTFLAGLSFENAPIALGAVIFVRLLFYIREGLHLWMTWIPLLSLFFGWLLLMTSPSTVFRVNYYRELFYFPGLTFDYVFKYRIPDVLGVFLSSSWILLVIFLASCVILVSFKEYAFLAATISGVAVTLVSLVPSPYTEQRAFTFAWLLMIVVALRAAKYLNRIIGVIQVLVIVIACLTNLFMIPMYSDFGSQLSSRDKILSEKLAGGCFAESDFNEIITQYPPRLLNNRDSWSVSSLVQVKKYYGCE